MQKTDLRPEVTLSHISHLLGTELVDSEPVAGGKNSQVYRITSVDGTSYAVKCYRGTTADGTDPLLNEYASLEFLRDQGVGCVPLPMAIDRNAGFAVYEFISGHATTSNQVTTSDVDQASRFLIELRRIASLPQAAYLPSAAEACFSVEAIFATLDRRLDRLMALDNASSGYGMLRRFLNGEFKPAYQDVSNWCRRQLTEDGTSPETELELRDRTLSPSDFGFHNCVRRGDGRLMFLDFEYFGWDDPAKMIVDFLLHPAMDLSPALKKQFLEALLQGMDGKQILCNRLRIVYPLFGLKWCLILLNEFLPEKLIRRGLSGPEDCRTVVLQKEQLDKARSLLHSVRGTYERFLF